MKLIHTLVLFGLMADVALGQLTVEQKVADFQQIAGLYAKRYAPYEWKRDVFGFDLLNAAQWIHKVHATKDDLDFYEVLSEYVSKLNDAHDVYTLPANFFATLNFTVDIYDDKLLVDSINRTRLPATEFPFGAGYELVSIDGQPAKTLLRTFLRYQVAANDRSTSRFAATLLTSRPQQLMPHAPDVPEISTVVFRRPDSQREAYRIPWVKTGLPLTAVGKYITPSANTFTLRVADDSPPDEIPAYLAPLIRLQNTRIPDRTVLGFSSLTPIFAQSLPPGFVRRLGLTGDPFFSGIFEARGFRIGFIRIPNYQPTNRTAALTAFQNEMAYFQANTDGLVIDDMRNPGGTLSYVDQLLSLVIPVPWRAMGFEVRATSEWVMSISIALEQAKAAGAPQNIIDLLAMIKGAIVNANASFRGRTEPIPLDDVRLDRSPLTDSRGNLLAYTKPLIVLIDEMTASGAEVFAAGIQDNARGRLVGWRTMGAGGSVEDWEAGSYSLGSTRVTESLMNRGHNVVTRRGHEETSYPVAPYVENIGVHPDLLIDYMTTDNLYQSGKPFVDAFVTAIVNQILNRPSGGVRGEGEGDNSTGRRSNDHEKTHPQGLTPAQKEADFRYLASLYSTYYAPLEWKKQLFGFNALNLKPWLDRVAMTTTDLDFYELCVEYVASLNDTHDAFLLPSDFVATLGFGVDIYDGVLLIDTLNRTILPSSTYPFTIGDELVSVDGVPVEQLLQDFAKYAPQGNRVSTRRLAANRITSRPQVRMPHASDLGQTATVLIRRQNGDFETYTIPWVKTGTPVRVGPVPSPKSLATQYAAVMTSAELDYMAELEQARFSGVLRPEDLGVRGYGARDPIFVNALAQPALRFTRRRGGAAADLIYSGTFQYEELTIGYIRVPNYAPPSATIWLQQLEQEIAFMNANTGGLILDEMRNTGGNLCNGQELVRRLVPYSFQATGFALRPFWSRVLAFYNSLISARASNAPPDVIQQYEQNFNEMLAANQQGRLVTKPLPLCSASLTRTAATDQSGNVIAYSKPLVMLIDEFSTSTADSVPSMIQDARRGLLYGKRTNGAGGNNTSFDAGPYSEGAAGMTLALQVRSKPIATTDYPVSDLIENVGVRPDFEADYMTKDNLLQNGFPFVNALLQHTVSVIRNQNFLGVN